MLNRVIRKIKPVENRPGFGRFQERQRLARAEGRQPPS
jgi:hypothetical protein